MKPIYNNWTLVTDTNRTKEVRIDLRNLADHPIETRWFIELPQRWAFYDKNDKTFREMQSSFYTKSKVHQPCSPTDILSLRISKTIPLCFDKIKVTAISGDTILHEETVTLTIR